MGGYHGAKLARYQDLIDRYLSYRNDAVLDMLNTRYLIVPGDGGQPKRCSARRPTAPPGSSTQSPWRGVRNRRSTCSGKPT